MVCEKRKGKPHARARSPRLAWPGRAGPWRGVAWRGEARRTCDMRVNGPPKSGPSPCRSAASFCRFIFMSWQTSFLISCPVSIRIRNRVGLGLWSRHNTASGPNIYTATGCGQRHTEKHLGFCLISQLAPPS